MDLYLVSKYIRRSYMDQTVHLCKSKVESSRCFPEIFNRFQLQFIIVRQINSSVVNS